MAHSHCMGPGTMDLYTMLCTVHTTLRQEPGQGMGMGTNGLHTHFPVPFPVLVPGSVQCE